jgi:hypothetical protein
VKEQPFSFGSAKTLWSHIELLPLGSAQWQLLTILPDSGHIKKPIELLYHDPVEVVQELLCLPLNKSTLSLHHAKFFKMRKGLIGDIQICILASFGGKNR